MAINKIKEKFILDRSALHIQKTGLATTSKLQIDQLEFIWVYF